MKRVFIVHGWGGNPNEPWLTWLTKELKSRGIKTIAPHILLLGSGYSLFGP